MTSVFGYGIMEGIMSQNNIKKTLLIYLKTAWNYKKSFLTSYTAIIASTIVGLIIPLYVRDIIDAISNSADRMAAMPSIYGGIIIIVVLEMISWALWRTVEFNAIYFQSHCLADLSNMCFAYLHKHSYTFFSDNFGGSLVKKVKWFSNAFENISDRLLWNFLPLVISITVITFILGRINIWLGLIVFLWVIFFLALSFLFTRYKLRFDIQRSEAETAATGLLADTITNHANVKFFNGYADENTGFKKANSILQKARAYTWNMGGMFFALQSLLWIGLEVCMYYFGAHLWSVGLLTAGGFVMIQTYIVSMFRNLWDFGRNLQRFYESLADAEEMTVILETPHDITDIPTAQKLIVTEGNIQFKDVTFNYNETRSVLEHFSLSIKPQEKVALIGPSGAGKTTVIKLLFRMHDVTGGHIEIDGQNIAHVTQESLWENTSLVPQDPILFHRSLMENIRYGKPSATDAEVMEAAKLARCHDFISETSHGYDTYVGERGIKLSGGERQRVAIARAILKNAPILVLDEATSSLDSKSEHLIQEALGDLMKEKTVIVIAHRLSTIRKMDRIIVVENGHIAEEGDHEGLVKNESGVYAKLWQLQAGGFIGE